MVLPLKLVLTPLLIGMATVAQRRYGHRIGGLLVGLPLTSGPVALLLALERGRSFTAHSARGTLLGLVAEVAFCLAYALVATHGGAWRLAAVAAAATYAGTATLLLLVPDPLGPTYLGVLLALALGLLVMPPGGEEARMDRPPWWDLPLRLVVATASVLALTAAAGLLGAKLTGLLSPFPIYAAVLTVLTHRERDARAATAVLRGVLMGLCAFATFFLVLGATLEQWAPLSPFPRQRPQLSSSRH